MRLLVIAFLLFAVQACQTKADSRKETNINRGEAIPVRVEPILGDSGMQVIHASGLLNTENEARLSFKIGGVIDRILVEEGQQVRRGQLLATLKSTEISAQVNQVKLGLEKAERDYQRAKNLYADSVATLEQLQNARTALDIAQQNYQQVTFNRQYSNITAPADGIVLKKILHEGEVVNPGSVVLAMSEVSSASAWILKAGVSDREWAAIETGDPVEVRFDAYPGQVLKGSVSRKAPAADAASGVFEIEVRVQRGDWTPAVGLFGKITVKPTRKQESSTIPYEALLEASGKKGYVFVTNDRKTVKRVEVDIASIGENRVQVSSGLEGYAYVVVSGSAYLKEGSNILVQGDSPKK